MNFDKNYLFSLKINDNKSKTFCSSIFNYVKIDFNNTFSTCCLNYTNIKINTDTSICDILNNEFFIKLRYDMLNNIKNDYCSKCYDIENRNIISQRLLYNNETNVSDFNLDNLNDDYTLKYYNIKKLEIRFSNKCNLKCRMCNSNSSSSWCIDEEKLYNKKIENRIIKSNINDIMINNDLSQLSQLVILGGEPLLEKKLYETLNILNKNIKIVIFSNMNQLTYKGYTILDFKDKLNLNIHLSLDDIFKRLEYVRSGSNFFKIIENINLLKNNIYFCIILTINIYNIYYITEILLYFYENFTNNIFINILNYPDYLSIINIPNNVKKIIIDRLNIDLLSITNEKIVSNIQYLIQILTSNLLTDDLNNKKILQNFFDWNDKLDLIRNEKFHDVFHDLYNILKN